MEVLAASRETRVGVYLSGCKEATAEVMARVVAALPDSLEHLSLIECTQLIEAPRIAALTQLQTLTIADCKQLTSLPDLSALTQLQKLDLGKGARKCDQLSVEQQARAQAVVAANKAREQALGS